MAKSEATEATSTPTYEVYYSGGGDTRIVSTPADRVAARHNGFLPKSELAARAKALSDIEEAERTEREAAEKERQSAIEAAAKAQAEAAKAPGAAK